MGCWGVGWGVCGVGFGVWGVGCGVCPGISSSGPRRKRAPSAFAVVIDSWIRLRKRIWISKRDSSLFKALINLRPTTMNE